MDTENRGVIARSGAGVKWVKEVKKNRLPLIKLICPRNIIYIMVTIMNNIVFCI